MPFGRNKPRQKRVEDSRSKVVYYKLYYNYVSTMLHSRKEYVSPEGHASFNPYVELWA